MDRLMRMMSDSRATRLAYGVRLRREYFGGLVYDGRNGNTVEVDKQTFQFLEILKDRPVRIGDVINGLIESGVIKRGDASAETVIQKLFDSKIIEDSSEVPSWPIVIPSASNKPHEKPWLSAPETVHWAVTYRCGQKCPDCYAGRFSHIKNEVTTYDAFKVIDKIARWNVFQLSLGGGEPFAREDLPQLVKHASDQGLSVHLTTGRLETDPAVLELVSPFIQNLQIGIRNDDLLGAGSKEYLKRIRNIFSQAQRGSIRLGANVILNRSAVGRLEDIVKLLSDIGFKRIVFLRYKPPQNAQRWEAELPLPDQMQGLHHMLRKITRDNPGLTLRVDCGLSFVQRYLPEQTASECGIKGCVAADRILALAPDGSVYPCSQLVHPQCYAGNLVESEPEALWAKASSLRKYRSFRAKKTFLNSWCGVCFAKSGCGGCRVFAMDGLGGDLGCPAPLRPPLKQLGKIGRRLDLPEHLQKYSVISVGEYMERYGVGQRTAIKELRTCGQAVSVTAKLARKKTDQYEYAGDNIIRDIQDSIGATSGGAPFATAEDIAQWVEDPECPDNYPSWIFQANNGEKELS